MIHQPNPYIARFTAAHRTSYTHQAKEKKKKKQRNRNTQQESAECANAENGPSSNSAPFTYTTPLVLHGGHMLQQHLHYVVRYSCGLCLQVFNLRFCFFLEPLDVSAGISTTLLDWHTRKWKETLKSVWTSLLQAVT